MANTKEKITSLLPYLFVTSIAAGICFGIGLSNFMIGLGVSIIGFVFSAVLLSVSHELACLREAIEKQKDEKEEGVV